jgi:hypothetical protein
MKILWETILLLGAVILIFTIIYHFLEQWDWVESFYSSAMISTLIGKSQPSKNATKLLMVGQALLSFVIAGRLILFFSNDN